ncbi:MAG: hypothetical protein M3014_03680, partial [Chloroflexota bacterium]|nr:hypothetical protein [Chloroflexota bacterium]
AIVEIDLPVVRAVTHLALLRIQPVWFGWDRATLNSNKCLSSTGRTFSVVNPVVCTALFAQLVAILDQKRGTTMRAQRTRKTLFASGQGQNSPILATATPARHSAPTYGVKISGQ